MVRKWRKANDNEGSSGRHPYPRLGGEVALDKEVGDYKQRRTIRKVN